MKEESFAKLFRSSRFAQFDPKIPRIYKASLYPSTLVTSTANKSAQRPAFFGFKRDIHPTQYGRRLEFIQMEDMDGTYGQCKVRNGGAQRRMYIVLTELQRLLGQDGSVNNGTQIPRDDFKDRPVFCEGGVRVPGRVLNRLESGGYAIGIGGLVAELPIAEIPPMQHFSLEDVAKRRAFYFYVKQATLGEDGNAQVIVSLRAQQ